MPSKKQPKNVIDEEKSAEIESEVLSKESDEVSEAEINLDEEAEKSLVVEQGADADQAGLKLCGTLKNVGGGKVFGLTVDHRDLVSSLPQERRQVEDPQGHLSSAGAANGGRIALFLGDRRIDQQDSHRCSPSYKSN